MKNNINGLYLFLSILLATNFGCRTQKEMIESKPIELKHWVSIQKFPCFGHCQVFDITVYRNGLVILEGKEHVEKKGVYFTELNDDKIMRLSRLSKSLSVNTYKDEYLVNIPDLPVTDIQFYNADGAKIKEIKANSNLPDELHNFVKYISELMNKETWTQVQKKYDMTNPEIISNEFLIDLDSSLTTIQLETDFQKFELKALRQVSAYMNLWSFQYNEALIGKYEMLILLRKKNGIRSVNFNRKLLPRE